MKYIIVICVLMICITIEGVVGIVYNSSAYKQYEPTAIQILQTLETVLTQLHEVELIVNDLYGKAGATRGLVEDTIQLIRNEINDYHTAFANEGE